MLPYGAIAAIRFFSYLGDIVNVLFSIEQDTYPFAVQPSDLFGWRSRNLVTFSVLLECWWISILMVHSKVFDGGCKDWKAEDLLSLWGQI